MELALPVEHTSPMRRPRRSMLLGVCGLAALAATVAAAALGAGAGSSRPELVALARALIVGVPMAAGLYTWGRHGGERFGLLLVGLGAGLFLTTLAESDDELLYTLGRLAGWLVEVLVVYAILSFPTGRLPEHRDRVLVAAMGLVVLTLFIPRLALMDDFEVPSPYTSCTHDCPSNAWFLLADEPAFADAVLRPAGALMVVVVMVAVLIRLRERMRDATPLARRMLAPVLVVGAARVGLLAVGFPARQANPTGQAVEVISWLIAFAVPAMALAFLLGILRRQLFAGRALKRLAECVQSMPDAETLRRAFAEAFDDPTVQIAFPAGGSADAWMDCWGRPTTLPPPGQGRSVNEVRRDGTLVAAVVQDDALKADPELVDAGVAMAGVVLDNERLAAEAEIATREVRQSRARIAASAELERRRIERDLHDGAQQRLVALRIELELAEEMVRRDPAAGVRRLRQLEHDVDEALEDLRSLAHGVYPPLLADRGLVEALLAAAMRSPMHVEVDARDVGRYPPEVEGAVYFCVLEALQNALKHAKGARRVVVRLDGGTKAELRFSVRDDGAGSPGGAVDPGAGLTNMRDRLAAVGGAVHISSAPGVGTTLRGRVPGSGLTS